ncbi:putative membrane protein [Bradyrhizobium sp. USDA 377]
MKLCVCVLSLVVGLLAHGAAAANQPKTAQPQTNPIGGMVFSGANHCCVGIGTASPNANLDVYQGELKVGSSGVGCSGRNEGSLRYAGKHLQLCDGTGWRNVSLDKAE